MSTDRKDHAKQLHDGIIDALAKHANQLSPADVAYVLTDTLADFAIFCKIPRDVFLETTGRVYDINEAYYADNPRDQMRMQ